MTRNDIRTGAQAVLAYRLISMTSIPSHTLSSEAQYALGDSESADLVAHLERAYSKDLKNALDRPDPLVVLRVEHDDPIANLARVNEQQVFASDLGANHTPELMAEEYGSYESDSVFYLAFDARERRVLGSSRAIFGSAAEPPKVFDLIEQNPVCRADALERHNLPLDMSLVRSLHDMELTDGIMDFATLAVAPDARHLTRGPAAMSPSILLYAAMVRESHFMRGNTFGCGEVTTQLLRFLRSLTGLPAVAIAGLEPFAAFEGDEVLSAPFIFRWSEWIEPHSGDSDQGTELGGQIFRLADGSAEVDPILFGQAEVQVVATTP